MKEFAGKSARATIGAWLMVATGVALAQTGAPSTDAAQARALEKLARERNCMTCHATDRTLLAPSYREIARRYAGKAGAVDEISRSIADGSRGKWGNLPMPASPQVAPDEATRLANWILGMAH
ncbi:c-type cytochrome [Pandoraea fibrosis]|nr:c-type cytochrome [Pandoraea fibrosis]